MISPLAVGRTSLQLTPKRPRPEGGRELGGRGSTLVGEPSVDAALEAMPKVEGGNGQLYLAQPLAKVFSTAEDLAKKAGDSFVTVERLLLALAIEKETEAGKASAALAAATAGYGSAVE